ncbi:hypothetical protein A6V36_33775 [Paraburkholderia ginsengiterrae]|uniref:Phenol degradation protein meta n=1 Tax=Paraburkholderia ginsengiterrae TaxID=1462993 RepID=A0A1A9N9C4_9BURK|nr:transporter [Paraburkholderia ginsengiterrae]OAJ56536.1 hypothetical protein A6V36_33775 [Paraburkholderia ginsengiterrae]OAJ61617.1 hypothetical protein A6V37_25045 [Paraburkholderia ginsengiterrae]
MKIHRLAALAVMAASLLAHAYDEPTVNLGSTSFIDVAPNIQSGWAVSQYFEYYSANKLSNNSGNRLPLPQESLDVLGSITQLIYLSEKRAGVPHWGVNVIESATLGSSINDGMGDARLKARNGLGDLRVGPFLQTDTWMLNGRPFLTQRFEFDFVIPTGGYNPHYTIDPGNNVWAINPYWAATLWLTPKWSASLRLHYLWSGRNDAPPVSLGPGARDVQAGQAVHANFASEYEIVKGFRLGVNAYWLLQFTDSKINGQVARDRRERVLGIGPGALWQITSHDHLYFNYYQELDVRNRPDGTRAFVRYMHVF